MNKFSRTVVAVFAMLGFLSLTTLAMPSAGADPIAGPAGAYDSIEKSLVYLETEAQGIVTYVDEAGKTQISAPLKAPMGFCTGFFVSREGHIMSAGHCPDADGAREALMRQFMTDSMPAPDPDNPFSSFFSDGPSIEVLEAHGIIPGSDPLVKVLVTQMECSKNAPLRGLAPKVADVIDYKPLFEGDLALLKIDVPMPTPPLTIAAQSPRNGAEVTVIGYPGVVSQAMGDLGETPNQCMSAFAGNVSAHQPADLVGWPSLELSAMMHGGQSGGPTINANGEVIGTNSWGLQDIGMFGATPTGINYTTDTPELRDFLAKNRVPFVDAEQLVAQSTTDKSVDTGTERDWTMTIDWAMFGKCVAFAIPVALVLGLVLAGLLVAHRRQTRKRPPAAMAPSPNDLPREE